MLSKVLAVTHSKVALAVLGAVLVGGGGSAVAVAATTGHLSTLGVNLASEHSNTATPDSHAHTIGVEGLLTACSASTPPATISVKDGAGKSWTFVVSATTRINGDTHTDASQGSHSTGAGASSAKGDNSANAGDNSTGAGASSAKGDNSTHAGGASTGTGASSAKGDNSANASGDSSNAGDNSAHAAPTLADVCASANIGTRDVQVQATKDGANYDAWKVTLQGPGSANSDGSSSGDSSSNGASSNASGD